MGIAMQDTEKEFKKRFLQINKNDNVLVALQDLPEGRTIFFQNQSSDQTFKLPQAVHAKHKFTVKALAKGEGIFMYGVLVGKVNEDLPQGGLITRRNTDHATGKAQVNERKFTWEGSDISRFKNKTFLGYHRADGKVGTANHWIVVPLVYCENRNIEILKDALTSKLGYDKKETYRHNTEILVELFKKGRTAEQIKAIDFSEEKNANKNAFDSEKKVFENIDGIKFLTHQMGCCCARTDSDTLCGLIAGYITHPNVAGATILSLGCQNAQMHTLEAEIKKRDPDLKKPLIMLEQQQLGTEKKLMEEALRQTFYLISA